MTTITIEKMEQLAQDRLRRIGATGSEIKQICRVMPGQLLVTASSEPRAAIMRIVCEDALLHLPDGYWEKLLKFERLAYAAYNMPSTTPSGYEDWPNTIKVRFSTGKSENAGVRALNEAVQSYWYNILDALSCWDTEAHNFTRVPEYDEGFDDLLQRGRWGQRSDSRSVTPAAESQSLPWWRRGWLARFTCA